MNDEDFANLVESIKQAGKIKKGLLQPSRTFEFNPPVSINSQRDAQMTVSQGRCTGYIRRKQE